VPALRAIRVDFITAGLLSSSSIPVVVNYASSKAGAESVVAAITKAGGKAVAVGGD